MRRITTFAQYDIETGQLEKWVGYHYDGPVVECKRDIEKQQATQTWQTYLNQALGLSNLQKQDVAQGIAATKGPMNLVDALSGFVQNFLKNPYGFTPQGLASLMTQARQGISSQFGSGLKALKEGLTARGEGGMNPQSGPATNQFGQFQAAQAGAQSEAQNQIQIANQQQLLQNLMGFGQMGNTTAGVGADLARVPIQGAEVLSPSPFVGGSTSALGTRAELGMAPSIGGGLLTSWLSPGKKFG